MPADTRPTGPHRQPVGAGGCLPGSESFRLSVHVTVVSLKLPDPPLHSLLWGRSLLLSS